MVEVLHLDREVTSTRSTVLYELSCRDHQIKDLQNTENRTENHSNCMQIVSYGDIFA